MNKTLNSQARHQTHKFAPTLLASILFAVLPITAAIAATGGTLPAAHHNKKRPHKWLQMALL
jgi:hypothetical protein